MRKIAAIILMGMVLSLMLANGTFQGKRFSWDNILHPIGLKSQTAKLNMSFVDLFASGPYRLYVRRALLSDPFAAPLLATGVYESFSAASKRPSDLSLGAGNANGIGLFVDSSGDDAYTVSGGTVLGRSNPTPTLIRRHLLCLGVFGDESGKDPYPQQMQDIANNKWWAQGSREETTEEDPARGIGWDLDDSGR